jgi:hypothetical protein
MIAIIQLQDCHHSCIFSKMLEVRIYETFNLPVVLYGCETWFPILRGKLEVQVLRKVFAPKMDEVSWKFMILHIK